MKRVSESPATVARDGAHRKTAPARTPAHRGAQTAKDPVGIVSFDEIRREYEAALEDY